MIPEKETWEEAAAEAHQEALHRIRCAKDMIILVSVASIGIGSSIYHPEATIRCHDTDYSVFNRRHIGVMYP